MKKSNIKILVDADACPVKEIIVKLAKEHNIAVCMFIDTCHILDDGYSKVITVDKAADSVDFAIVNNISSGDIVVTQDYGLASLVLSKNCHCINQNGMLYTGENIDKLLFERHLNKKIRQSGGKMTQHSKRRKEDNEKFEYCFRKLLLELEAEIF